MPSAPDAAAPEIVAVKVAVSPIGLTGVLFTTEPAEPVTPSVVSVAVAAEPVPAMLADPFAVQVLSAKPGRVFVDETWPEPESETVTVPLVVVTAKVLFCAPEIVGA